MGIAETDVSGCSQLPEFGALLCAFPTWSPCMWLTRTMSAFHWWLTAMPRFGVVWPYFVSATSSTLKWVLVFGYAVAVIHALTRAGG